MFIIVFLLFLCLLLFFCCSYVYYCFFVVPMFIIVFLLFLCLLLFFPFLLFSFFIHPNSSNLIVNTIKLFNGRSDNKTQNGRHTLLNAACARLLCG